MWQNSTTSVSGLFLDASSGFTVAQPPVSVLVSVQSAMSVDGPCDINLWQRQAASLALSQHGIDETSYTMR